MALLSWPAVETGRWSEAYAPGWAGLEIGLDCQKFCIVSPLDNDSCSDPLPWLASCWAVSPQGLVSSMSCLQNRTEKTFGLAWTRSVCVEEA